MAEEMVPSVQRIAVVSSVAFAPTRVSHGTQLLAPPGTGPRQASLDLNTLESARQKKPQDRGCSVDLPVRSDGSSPSLPKDPPRFTRSRPPERTTPARPSPRSRSAKRSEISPTTDAAEALERVRARKKSKDDIDIDETILQLADDTSGTLVRDSVERLQGCETWKEFVESCRGRPYLSENVNNIDHPAAPFLEDLRENGVPAKSSEPPLTPKERDNQFWRGAHASAEMNRAFVRKEMAEFIECGYWTVLPYRLVKDLPGLRISPLGVKEERERKPRLVCDHSFFGVNQHTLLRTPPEAMQFGGTLGWILHAIRHADPKHGPVFLSKYDIKDGFYRLFLDADDCPMLGVTLPHYAGEEPLIAIPLVLTMGWAESPPTF